MKETIDLAVTREQFLAYLVVQRSGLTNMWDDAGILMYAEAIDDEHGLDREVICEIRKRYSELSEEYQLSPGDEQECNEMAQDLWGMYDFERGGGD